MATDETDSALEAYVEALATIHGLVIDPAWRPAVLANMKTITQAAHLVMDGAFGDLDEAAPVFTA